MNTELRLHVELQNGRTTACERFCTSPLKVGMPKTENDRLHLILMMASAGVLEGDNFHYKMKFGAGTKTLITEQSYTKIFNTGEGGASKHQIISLEGNASLYYRPSTVIPFQNSTYDGELLVDLDSDSEFEWSDIVAAGRVGMGEALAFRRYHSRVLVHSQGVPVFIDHCLMEPMSMPLEKNCFLNGRTHQGSYYYCGPAEREEELLNWFHAANFNALNGNPLVSMTQAKRGICVRMLGSNAQDLEEVLAILYEITSS